MDEDIHGTGGAVDARVRGIGKGRARGKAFWRRGCIGGVHSTSGQEGCPEATVTMEENALATSLLVSRGEGEQKTIKVLNTNLEEIS